MAVPAALPVSEQQFTDTVIQYAHLRGWRVSHSRPCRTAQGWRTAVQGDAGFPDLVLIGPTDYSRKAQVIFAELKSERGRLTVEQGLWVEAIRLAGQVCYIWRPRDWDQIIRVLGDGRDV